MQLNVRRTGAEAKQALCGPKFCLTRQISLRVPSRLLIYHGSITTQRNETLNAPPLSYLVNLPNSLLLDATARPDALVTELHG